MRLKRKKYTFVALIIIFIFLVVEAGFQIAGLFYDPDADLREDIFTNLDEYQKIPHPYLGFVDANNRIDDISKNPGFNNHFILTIAGGSVAQQLCTHSRNMHHTIEKALEKKVKKPVLLNCLGIGSYTQPQQLIATLLYARKSDFYISIEGHNEFFDPKSVVHPDYPISRFQHLFFSDFRELFFSRNLVYVIANIEQWAHQRSIFDNLQTRKFLKKSIRASVPSFLSTLENHGDDVSIEIRRKIWVDALKDVKLILDGRKTPFFIVLQPLLTVKKNLTASEKKKIDSFPQADMDVFTELTRAARDTAKELQKHQFPIVDYNDRTNLIENKLNFTDLCHFTDETANFFTMELIKDIENALEHKKL